MRIRPASALHGDLRLPGDKSLSHRYILRAAMVRGTSRICNLNTGEDVICTLNAVEALGVGVSRDADDTMVLDSPGMSAWTAPNEPIDCGNSGTTARLLMGLLAGCPFNSTLVGDASLTARPMERVATALRGMGAEIHTREGAMPVEIMGRPLKGMEWKLPVPSAQLKSAVILAALNAEGQTSIEEALPSRDHTERMLGLNPEILESVNGPGSGIRRRWTVGPGDRPSQVWDDVELPGDPSAASFLVGAALVVPESRLLLHNVLINPYRRDFLDVLIDWGGMISLDEKQGEGFCGPLHCASGCNPGDLCPISEPVAEIDVRAGLEFETVELSGARIPRLIDEIPLLAAVALAHGQELRVKDAAELRLKESDRIAGICRMARAFGATAEEMEDGFLIRPRGPLHGARFDARGDHRLAMAAVVLALALDEDSHIEGEEAIRVSYPAFLDHIEQLRTA